MLLQKYQDKGEDNPANAQKEQKLKDG